MEKAFSDYSVIWNPPDIVLANHGKLLFEITSPVWSVFEEHHGNMQRLDDFELATFKP